MRSLWVWHHGSLLRLIPPLLFSVIHCVHTWTLLMCDLQCRCPPWLAQELSVPRSKQQSMQCTLLQGTLLDVSIIHHRCPTYVATAFQTRGAAAAPHDRSKYRAHASHLHRGHSFVSASVEMYGHLSKHVMRCIRALSDIASTRSLAVAWGSFLASAHLELSVALGQSQGRVCHSCALLLAKATEWQVLPGADTPLLDWEFCCLCGA
jgi:hypothetical protein